MPLPPTVRSIALALCLAASADWFVVFTLFWLAAARGWSGGQLAVLVLAARLPTLVGGTVGGRLVDRFGPRRMMMVDAWVRGAICLALTVRGMLGATTYTELLVAAAVTAAFAPASYAAARSAIPPLVGPELLPRANALLSLADPIPIIVAAVSGGLAIVALGNAAFLVPTLLMCATLVVVRTLPRGLRTAADEDDDAEPAGRTDSPWRFRPAVALIALSTAYFFVYGPMQPVLPIMVKEQLDGGAWQFSVLRLGVGLGAVVGILLGTALARTRRPGVVNAVGAVAYGAAILPLAFTHSVPVAACVCFLSGVIWGPYATVEATALQQWTPRRHHGRVFGTQRALLITALPLGGALGSLALDRTSPGVILGVTAVACLLVGLVALCVPAIRHPVAPRRSEAAPQLPPPGLG